MPKVTFLDDDKTVEVAPGTPLIKVCEDNDIDLPFGCTNGVCGTCVCIPTEGAENLAPPDELERNTLEGLAEGPEQRLACQAVVEGDVSIKYE